MGGGGSGADHLSPIQTGLSPQDSTLIDKLSISNSVNHNSLSGSPFLSSSIPLLDQFRDSSLSARDSPGLHPFARSPVSNGGIELTRHAFTSVEMAGIVSSADNGGIDSAGSLRSGHYFGHHHHHHQHHHISYLQSVSSLSAGVDSHDSSRDGTPALAFRRCHAWRNVGYNRSVSALVKSDRRETQPTGHAVFR
ncbi:hypothetical protein FBU59_005325 [Linderina macrospora]|uniref:Uncharacterized protein n=1 Tax=Linderina macrospora TaxID=4868 RepID=A0ACC1J380_9FUNG|nr:hypothetical protein FBU59_005325 [Linderina macrospora]